MGIIFLLISGVLANPVGVKNSETLESTSNLWEKKNHSLFSTKRNMHTIFMSIWTLTLSSAIDWRFLSGFCWLTGPEVLGLPGGKLCYNWILIFGEGKKIEAHNLRGLESQV